MRKFPLSRETKIPIRLNIFDSEDFQGSLPKKSSKPETYYSSETLFVKTLLGSFPNHKIKYVTK